MAKVPEPTPPLSPQAQAVYDRLVSNRGRIDGMYRTLLNHPDLLELIGALGTFFRYGPSRLPADLRELAILRLAQSLGAAYEWVKHEGPARQAGLAPEIIEDLRRGNGTDAWPDLARRTALAVDLVLARASLPADLQEGLARDLGLEAVLELVALCGFYQMIAGVIFAFDVPLPPGEKPPFPDGGR